MKERPVIDMKSAKQKIERKKYAGSVLDAFDRLSHQDRKEKAEQRSEVERAARQKL